MQSVILLLSFSRQNLFFQFLRLTCNSIFRVEEYITSGRDKTIVDPEPTGLYTKRKQQIEDSLNTDPVAKVDVANYPESGWGNSLEKMPMFTRAEMNEHIARSERIAFDSDYWRNLQTELLNYYFLHFIKFAAEDYQKNAVDN